MKVVLFCGGLGTRLREHSDTIPKPLVNVGYRPILWHLMRYYAHYGHTEFILCLGYRGDLVRDYFLRYDEAMTNDFTLHGKDRRVELHSRDLDDWKITFVDTGLHSNIGQRLMRVRKYVEDEEVFLANYADGLSDLPLDRQIAEFHQTRCRRQSRGGAQQPELSCGAHRGAMASSRAWAPCPISRSGSTADSSSCGRTSSTTCGKARNWWKSRFGA